MAKKISEEEVRLCVFRSRGTRVHEHMHELGKV